MLPHDLPLFFGEQAALEQNGVRDAYFPDIVQVPAAK